MGTLVEEDGLLSDWLLYVCLFMDNSAESNPEPEQVQEGSRWDPVINQTSRTGLSSVRFGSSRTELIRRLKTDEQTEHDK